MATTVKVEGLSQLAEAFRLLPQNIGKNVLRGAVYRASKVVRDAAKELAPVESGTLKRSIYMKQIRERSGPLVQTFYVSARKGKKYRKKGKGAGSGRDAYYAGFVEFGHFTRGSKGRLRKTNRGQANNQALADMVQTGQVRWVSPKPFMRPAWDSRKREALDNMVAYFLARIPAEVRKSRRYWVQR